jgi:transposase
MGAIQQGGKLVVLKDGGTRRFRSKQERRAIVEETLKPGASVSLVAREHDVNTNQVFKWRRQYRDGHLEIAAGSNALVPVRISDTAPMVRPAVKRRQGKVRRTGVIDIDLGHARVRIEGAADPDCVQAALERLIR